MGAHALGFVGYLCSTNFYLLFYPSSTHVGALSQFLLYIALLSPAELVWSQVIRQLCESDRGFPVIEISSFLTNVNRNLNCYSTSILVGPQVKNSTTMKYSALGSHERDRKRECRGILRYIFIDFGIACGSLMFKIHSSE
jgi:hypothetical protein